MRGRIVSVALLIVLLAGTAPALAQDAPMEPAIGLKAGVNLSNFEVTGTSTSKRPGFVGGAYARFPMSPIWGFELDILYSQKGFTKSSYDGITNWEMKTTYLEFPLTARLDIPSGDMSPFIFGGFSAGVKLGAEEQYDGSDGWQDVSDVFESVNWTFVFGLGLSWNHFQLEGRFNQGLSELTTSDYRSGVEDRTLSFTLGYDIFK